MTQPEMPPPRQIVLLSTDFKPMIGGVADHLHRLADAMAGHVPVTVMTSAVQNGARWPHAYELEPLPPVPVREPGGFGDALMPVRKLRTGAYFLKLREYGNRTIAQVTSRLGGDAAVLIGIWDMAGHAWCAACRQQNVPYYLLAHGAEVVMPLSGHLPERRAEDFQAASRVIANSTATAHLTADRLKLMQSPVVVNPSVGPRPDPAAIATRARQLREQLGVRAGPMVFSLGRLVRRKGFDVAIQAIASISDYPDLTYLIVGDGPERTRLEALAAELGVEGRVRFLGAVDELTKWAAYEACDVFLMPNRQIAGTDWEGFGIVFLEAALAGRPAIAGRTGGVADAVVHNATGVLIDPESPEELSEVLLALLRDPALRERLGNAGRARAQTRFTSAAAAASLRAQMGWSRS